MRPWRRTGAPAVGAVIAVVWAATTISPAQPIIGPVRWPAPSAATSGELAQNVFVRPERRILLQLADARRLLEAARYGEAVRSLGAILDGPEDYFFQPDKDVPIHRSLKAEAKRLIGQMPPEGLKLYELHYGARARQRLAEALSEGDAVGLAEVARRFFHTQSGYEATLLLGLNHLDHARPLAGALSLQRLREATARADQFEPTLSFALATCWLQAEMPEKARDVLSVLKGRLGGSTVEVAGRPVEWFADESKAVGWLAALTGPPRSGGPAEAESWPMFRGNASRNATTAASAPLLNMRWRIPTADDPMLEAKLRRDRQVYLDRGIPTLPGLHPLATGDVVLMRTFRNLLAVDFATGKRLWEVPVDDPLEELLGSNALQTGVYNSSLIAAGVGYRVWDDATYGTMSSDGRCVFTVEDLSVTISTSSSSRRAVIVNGRSVASPVQRQFNRLAAHDIRTGKLKWHIGGPSGQFALRQAETFFLGPPLPLMKRLYVLGEVKGEIRLFALEAESGDLIWSQQLALVERDILQDPFRRLAGVSPSYADGILVCPTSAGAVVAVDLATRSLLWGYRYGRYSYSSRNSQLIVLRTGRYPGPEPQNRWFDAGAIVADGRVLVTPLESDSLHCLNLIDGELLWKYRRNDDLFVACVHGDSVVLAGRRQVRAVSLSQTFQSTEKVRRTQRSGRTTRSVETEEKVVRPKPAWDNRSVALPEGSMPSGRGFFSSDKYFLPLSSAEVLAVDLTTGKALQVSKSRKGNVPGNLICYKGKVISQGVDGLEVFAQLDAVRREVDRRLAAKPDDPVALSLRGEVLLDEGKQAEAIASFRRAYALDSDPRTRGLLRDALLDGLRLQFATHRHRTEEIERLIESPDQRARYLRLMATGLQGAGEWQAALDHYIKLIDLDRDHRRLEPVTNALSVRLDRWIRAQFSEFRREAGDELEAIDRTVEARLQAAIEADAPSEDHSQNAAPHGPVSLAAGGTASLAAGSTASLRRFLDYFADHPSAGKARRELIRRLRNSGRWLEAELALWQQQRSSDPSVAGPALAELGELFRQAKRPDDAAWCYRRLGREFAEVDCFSGMTGRQLLEALPADGPVQQVLRSDGRWPVGKVIRKATATSSRTTSYPQLTVPYRGSIGPFFSETEIEFDQRQLLIGSRGPLGKKPWQLSLGQAGVQRGFPFNYSLSHARVCGHFLLLSLGYKIMAIDTLEISSTGQPKVLWSQDLADPTLDLTGNFQQMAAIQMGAIQPFGGPWGMQQFAFGGYPATRNSGLGPVTAAYACFLRYRDLVATDPLTGEVLWIRHGVAPGSTLFGDDRFLFAVPQNQTEATVFRALDGKLLGKRQVPRFTGVHQVPSVGTIRTTSSSMGPVCIATFGRQILIWSTKEGEAILELFDPWQQRQLWPPRKFAAAAQAVMVGREAIGVLEPGGHFVLVGLPDGRTIADVRLELEKTVTSLSAFRCGDQYMLVTAGTRTRPVKNRVIQVLPGSVPPGSVSKPIGNGRIYAFDLDGKLLWPEPVPIKDQHLLLNQPGRLPVITFACGVYDRAKAGTARHQVSILCIDKRTGRTVYEGGFPYTSSTFGLIGDPKANTVELHLPKQKVTLTFTNQPVPPPSQQGDKTDGLPSELPDIARGLLKAVGKAIGNAASSPPKSTPQPAPAGPPNQPPP